MTETTNTVSSETLRFFASFALWLLNNPKRSGYAQDNFFKCLMALALQRKTGNSSARANLERAEAATLGLPFNVYYLINATAKWPENLVRLVPPFYGRKATQPRTQVKAGVIQLLTVLVQHGEESRERAFMQAALEILTDPRGYSQGDGQTCVLGKAMHNLGINGEAPLYGGSIATKLGLTAAQYSTIWSMGGGRWPAPYGHRMQFASQHRTKAQIATRFALAIAANEVAL